MMRQKRPFESEKLQLQELNQRLSQYLLRSKQLEQENACLTSEINSIRHNRSGEWENKHMSELRDMRRLMERLSFEKCRAEMEREKLRNELQMLQAMRSDEAAVSKSIDTEVKGWERELHHSLHTNVGLEDRLIQLENEYKFLEGAHRTEVNHLRDQVRSRAVRVVTQTYHAPPVTMEEMQHYAANFTESCQETLDMYRLQVNEIEESIKADQAMLQDIQREKKEHAAQFNRLREEIKNQTQVQMHLEEKLMNTQEQFRAEVNQYQGIIEDLEYERRLLSNTISEKLKDHQDLLQVKMGLALEVAAYRALLEEEGRHAQMWSSQHSRERTIDIKMPPHPYSPRVSTTSASLLSTRKQFAGYDVKYMEPNSSMRTSAVSSQFHSQVPSRIVPITVSDRAQQSPVSRRDMIAFTKAAQAAAKPSVSSLATKREIDVGIKRKEVSQLSSKSLADHSLPRIGNTSSSPALQTAKPMKVVSPTISKREATVEETHQKEPKRMESKQDTYQTKTTTKEENQHVEEKVLDAVSMEDIIQQVMKPAGLDPKVCSSPDSRITYHVEKTEQEDGSTKTQIVLQSKVEEELDLEEDSALEEFLSKGVKKITLENIKGTPTGNMIQNLLSLGLEGESLGNRTVNVEIIEEPVESESDEGENEIGETMEMKSKPKIKPSSVFFQLEELESDTKPLGEKPEMKDDTFLIALVTYRKSKREEQNRRVTIDINDIYIHVHVMVIMVGHTVSVKEHDMSSSYLSEVTEKGHTILREDWPVQEYYFCTVEHKRRYFEEFSKANHSGSLLTNNVFFLPISFCVIEYKVRKMYTKKQNIVTIFHKCSSNAKHGLFPAPSELMSLLAINFKSYNELTWICGGVVGRGVSASIMNVSQFYYAVTTTFVSHILVVQQTTKLLISDI
ncbi:Synemin [Triplophysa tibetana]|uniref:Synemin n=1 Tax=Triplophysa tibetana TaxID=1572043 RepID=A0A5A9NXL2_9TELE|nr:Synemin [Triplophysa tibetana]